MTRVWVLADDRAGNVNQLLGIADVLGEPYERKDIRYTKWVRLPNCLRGSSCVGITSESQQNLCEPWPDVVLSAGRRSFPVARYIQKKSGGKTKVVQLMNPGYWGANKADLIILPAHDKYNGRADNVSVVTGAPHRVTGNRLKSERQYWKKILGVYPSKRVALIVGGATKDKPFTIDMAQELIEKVKSLQPGSVLVTTSRRTPPEIVSLLEQNLPTPSFFYRYGDAGENPYFGLLAYADEIVVTGDSISMCSECCAAGVPVFIFAPEEMMGPKHKRFHATLYREGYAAPLGGSRIEPKGSLNAAFTIAERVRELLVSG